MNNKASALAELKRRGIDVESLLNNEPATTPISGEMTDSYNPVNSFLRGATDSATLGFGSKIIGGALAPILKFTRPDLFGNEPIADIYQQARDVNRQQNAESAAQNPISSIGGSLLGGLALPFPAKNIKQGAGLGALYGGAYGLGSNDDGEVGTINADNVIGGLYGAGTGAGLGALGTLGSKLFSQGKAPSPEDLELLTLSKQFDIPATYGELSQNPQSLLKEEAALKGRLGNTNQKNLSEFKDLQQERLSDAASNLKNQIGSGDIQNRGEAAREAITNLQNEALKERGKYGKIYDEAKQNLSTISKVDFGEFGKQLENSLLEDVLTRDNVPKAFGEIDALEKIFTHTKQNDINIKQLEAWRQGLNQTYKSALNAGDEKTGFALNKVKKQFDDFLDNSIESALATGDQIALDKFKEGRKLTAEWYKKYGSDGSKNFGKKFIEDVVTRARVGDESLTDEMLVNKIFGTSELGFKPESAIIVKELKKVLPAEDFNKIKLEAAQKILSPLITENPSAAKYKTNLTKLIGSNVTLTKELFSPQEIKQLTDLSKIGESIFTRKKSLVNPSGTAEVVLDYLDKKTGTGFLKNLFNKVQLDQSKIEKRLLKGEKQINEPSILFKTFPLALQNQVNDAKDNNLIAEQKPEIEKLAQQDIGASENSTLQSSANNMREKVIAELAKRNIDWETGQPKESRNHDTTNQNLLNKIAKVESGGNPNARSNTSSASGLFQFTDSTWKEMVNKHGKEYGITNRDKNDPEAQKIMAQKLLDDNKKYLTKALERNPSNGELYLAHFMGAGGAAKLISSNPSQVAARIFPKEAKANKAIFFSGNRPRTTKEVYNLITTKV